MKKEFFIVGIVIVAVAIVCAVIGFFVSSYLVKTENKEIIYKNSQYGFQITLPSSWAGYSVEDNIWQGQENQEGGKQYSGPRIIIKNPKTTANQAWQDIPIMVFTKDVWDLVSAEKVAVSAAPIGPAKIGQNSKYVFATPPRWYGFTDAVGWQEAVDAVKTFKAF